MRIDSMFTAAALAVCVGCGQPDVPDMAMTPIYAEEDWYRARPEPEERWLGVLRQRDVVVGPATRLGLDDELDTGPVRLPVYSAGPGTGLATFVGREVVINGKLVDLSNEGFARELWIGALRTVEEGLK